MWLTARNWIAAQYLSSYKTIPRHMGESENESGLRHTAVFLPTKRNPGLQTNSILSPSFQVVATVTTGIVPPFSGTTGSRHKEAEKT